jgi:hypothetical protein
VVDFVSVAFCCRVLGEFEESEVTNLSVMVVVAFTFMRADRVVVTVWTTELYLQLK